MIPLTTIVCDHLQLEQETKTSANDHELEQIQNTTCTPANSIPIKPSRDSSDDSVTAATEDCRIACCRSLTSSLSLASSPSFARIKTPSAKKKVRFVPKATVRPICRMSLDTHAHLWHSDAEKNSNEQEMVKHVENFRRKCPQEQQECISHDYMRGLEQFASASLQRELREERQALMDAVLETQNGQRKQLTKNSANIEAQTTSRVHVVEENALDLALVSAALSMPARKRALALGLQDAKDEKFPM